MNNTEIVKKDNDSKKIFTMLIMILSLMLCTTGATYAYLAFSASATIGGGSDINKIADSGLTLSITQASLESSNTGVMVPQLEAALGTAMNSTNKCVDGNGNIVCKVYTITVSASGTDIATTPVTGTIKFTNPTTNLKWKLVSNATTVGSVGTAAAATTSEASFATPTFTASAKSFTYYIVFWIQETGAVQTDSGTWSATITFDPTTGSGITSTITS